MNSEDYIGGALLTLEVLFVEVLQKIMKQLAGSMFDSKKGYNTPLYGLDTTNYWMNML